MILDVALDADPEWDSSIGWADLAEAAAGAAIAESRYPRLAAGPRSIELSVRLAENDEVRALNAKWRGKDKTTNVLSFPLSGETEFAAAPTDGPELMLGDIIIARGVCAAEAAEKAVSIDQHAAHLLVHGTLHLLGYDHQDDEGAADMEARETRALARLGIADPYREDR
jgi:probable rRNA maturation factor